MSKDFYFIVNPASNTGRLKKKWKKLLPNIEEFAKEHQIEFDWKFTEAPFHAMKIAEEAEELGYSQLIAVGGDGVANEVGNYILQNSRNITLGLIPMGTSNDLHNTHFLPQDPIECLEVLTNGYKERLPVGRATGDFEAEEHYFLNHSDCGISSLAAKSARDGSKILKGEFKYTYHAIKKILGLKNNPATIIIDGEEKSVELSIIAAGLGDMMGGYNLWPDNGMRFGNFGIVMAYGRGRLKLLKLLLDAEKGKHLGKKGVEYVRGKRLEIHLEKPWPFEAEGEIFTDNSKEMVLEYIPDALEYLTVEPAKIPEDRQPKLQQ